MAVELKTEAVTLQRIKSGKLVEGLEHMSPTYLEGIKRILTVSADTELISAPAYFRAAQDAPSLNAFGTAISIVQDELAHAHIAYRLLEDVGVDKEETFHLRHGQQWIRRLAPDPEERAKLQRAADWMFMLTVEWFGLPDSEKRHTEQLDYGFKGRTNDQLRQAWMAKVVPFCGEVGLNVPAHLDNGTYVLDVPFPARFDAEQKRWAFEEGAITWQDVLKRWKGRGPMNEEYVASLQRGFNKNKNKTNDGSPAA